MNDVCDCLRISRRARATAVDAIVDMRELVGNAIGLCSSGERYD